MYNAAYSMPTCAGIVNTCYPSGISDSNNDYVVQVYTGLLLVDCSSLKASLQDAATQAEAAMLAQLQDKSSRVYTRVVARCNELAEQVMRAARTVQEVIDIKVGAVAGTSDQALNMINRYLMCAGLPLCSGPGDPLGYSLLMIAWQTARCMSIRL